jgi:hypothetical protein
VALLVSGLVDCEPCVGLLPDQPPEAVHEVALSAFHVSIELLPDATVFGAALITTEVAADLTVTVTDCVALPPAPVQLSV